MSQWVVQVEEKKERRGGESKHRKAERINILVKD
jgi:hypothetical protein